MNSFGSKFIVTTFGESHSPALGGVIDGCPPGVLIDIPFIQTELARRRGDSPYTTARKEDDNLEFLSGIYQGRTIGSPIAYIIRNKQQKSDDYNSLESLYRPGHGDYTWEQKYGIRDHRGGGRVSARETVARVVAGAIAKQILQQHNITLQASVVSIGGQTQYNQLLSQTKQEGDTLGGIITCTIKGVSAGMAGTPIFHKLQARLAAAMLSIPSVTGFEFGEGFAAANLKGSEYIDCWNPDLTTATNHCGGIQGGISNGMDITFRVSFHPIVTLPKGIPCATKDGQTAFIKPDGRHDCCQVLRAPVIVESMAALTLINDIL